MSKGEACTDAETVSKSTLLATMLDAIQVTFPATADVLAHLFDTIESKPQIAKLESQNSSENLPRTTNVKLPGRRFSLWMLQKIITNWIDGQPSSTLKRLLTCILSSSRYYSSVCCFILHNLTDRTRVTLVDKLLLHQCTIMDGSPALSESLLCSRHLTDFFAESSEVARSYFLVDTRLICLQLRCMIKQDTSYFGIFLLDCSRKVGEPWRWQSVTEVQYFAGDHVHCPQLFDIVHIKYVSKETHCAPLYEVALVLCTNTSVYFVTFLVVIASSIAIREPRVHKSHSTADFLGALFSKQEAQAKRTFTLLDFFYIANSGHEHPYLCILSPFLPVLFAVSGEFLESFFLERGDGGCTVLGILTSASHVPIILTAEGKAYRVSVTHKHGRKCMPHLTIEELAPIKCSTPLWTITMAPNTTMVVLEQGRVLVTDPGSDQAGLIEKQLAKPPCKGTDAIAHALITLRSGDSPPLCRIMSIGLLRISPTLTCVIVAGRTWNRGGLLAVYDTVKWNIRVYSNIFPVTYLNGKRMLSRWALLDGALLRGPN
ncbi:Hypothetical protein GL50581_2271 [Giardia duodenalis ATCC 50581]|uniref:Uncharacterized protein n=1 Tax=Giardia intestinalis (strain ATCC 50581 / GS clone H7) TaxID=598745 RepID=C6LU23_GIAIB|nr:Hypothetical protein GL50581_2271 [Giardia intestinalis ATCC 50581]